VSTRARIAAMRDIRRVVRFTMAADADARNAFLFLHQRCSAFSTVQSGR
jgi:hypothetical protein